MAESMAGLFPMASLTMVCSTMDSSLGTLVAVTGRVAGLRGRFPRGGGAGRLSWYGFKLEGSTMGGVEDDDSVDVDADGEGEAMLWSYVM